jgi:hypothetical protein
MVAGTQNLLHGMTFWRTADTATTRLHYYLTRVRR